MRDLKSEPTVERDGAPRLAYVLKAYPRASEPFILSEIQRLEELGLALRLFATKPAEANDSVPRHPVVDRIRARPEFLTPTASVSEGSLLPWLRAHGPLFWPAWRRVALRHPAGMLRALATLGLELDRSRRRPSASIKRSYVREFLHAVELVDRLRTTPSVRHLHAHYAHGATTVAWFAACLTGMTFSFTGHAKDIYAVTSNTEGALRRKLDSAHFAVTCTAANQKMLQTVAPSATIHCCYHGLNADFSRLLRLRPPPERQTGRFRILAVGRLVRKKGFDVLVEAAALLRREAVGCEIVIIGSDGDHAQEIRRLIADRGLTDCVSLSGPQDQAGLFDEYHRAHVFCLPCRVLQDGDRDGIPNVLMEAMACGTPVVTTDVSGIPELVHHEVNGFLVPPDNPRALAAALARAQADPSLMSRMSRAARTTVREGFDGEYQARRLAELFLETVA
jgi:glycosyltransferase involved in cell wall biosynthesis